MKCPLHPQKQARPESGLCLGCEAMLRHPGLPGEARRTARLAAKREWLERYAPHQLCSPPDKDPEEASPPTEPSPPAKPCRVHPDRPTVTAGLCQSCQASLVKIERTLARLPAEGTATRQALEVVDAAWRERRPHLSALYAQMGGQALASLRGTIKRAPLPPRPKKIKSSCPAHPGRAAESTKTGICASCRSNLRNLDSRGGSAPSPGTAASVALLGANPDWVSNYPHLSRLRQELALREQEPGSPPPPTSAPPQSQPEPDVGTSEVPAEEPTLKEIDEQIQVLDGVPIAVVVEPVPEPIAVVVEDIDVLDKQIAELDAQRETLSLQLAELRARRRHLVVAEALLTLHPPPLEALEEICPEQVYVLHLAYAQLRASLAASLTEAGHG